MKQKELGFVKLRIEQIQSNYLLLVVEIKNRKWIAFRPAFQEPIKSRVTIKKQSTKTIKTLQSLKILPKISKSKKLSRKKVEMIKLVFKDAEIKIV